MTLQAKQVTVIVAEVDEDPDNARKTFDPVKLKALGASLKDHQQDDIHIRSPAGKRQVLVDGARRLRAAKLAGIKELRAKDWGDVDHQTAVRLAATSALEKEGLTPLEEARLYQRLVDAKVQKKEIMATYGVPFNTLQGRLELLDLPENVAERVGDARGATNGTVFGLGHAKALLPLAKQPRLLDVVIKAFDKAKELPDAKEAPDYIIEQLEDAGAAFDPDHVVPWDVRQLPEYRKRVLQLPHVELPTSYGRKEILVTDKPALEALAKELVAKVPKPKASTSSSSAKAKATSLDDQALLALRSAQVDLAAKRLADLAKWPDDLQQLLVGSFLRRASAPSQKAEREALAVASGLSEADVSHALRYDNKTAIDRLWSSSKAKLYRLVAMVLFFDTRASKQLTSGPKQYQFIPYSAAPHDKLFTGSASASLREKLKASIRSGAKPTADLKSGKAGEKKCEVCGVFAQVAKTATGALRCVKHWPKARAKPNGPLVAIKKADEDKKKPAGGAGAAKGRGAARTRPAPKATAKTNGVKKAHKPAVVKAKPKAARKASLPGTSGGSTVAPQERLANLAAPAGVEIRIPNDLAPTKAAAEPVGA